MIAIGRILNKRAAVVKVSEHTKEQTPEALMNKVSDQTARKTALLPLMVAAPSAMPAVEVELLRTLQNQTSPYK